MLENSENYTQVINIGLNHQFEKKKTNKRKCMQTILYINFFYHKYAS